MLEIAPNNFSLFLEGPVGSDDLLLVEDGAYILSHSQEGQDEVAHPEHLAFAKLDVLL